MFAARSIVNPCEILLAPAGHWLEMNVIYSATIPFLTSYNFLNLIVAQSATNSTAIDGSTVAATNFVAIGTSGYYGAQISVTDGAHTVTSPQPVDVEVYGFGFHDAYGYFGGMVK